MKILFLHQRLWPYVERDLRILREDHEVWEVHFRSLRDIPAVWKGVRWADLVYTWFASLHAFFGVLFARCLGKRSIVVAGGWDVGKSPDGMLYDWRRSWCPRYVVSHADLTLFVSHSNQADAMDKLGGRVKQWQMVYHGFEAERFSPVQGVERISSVVLVSGISWFYQLTKGLDIFIETANHLPEIPFILAGPWMDDTVEKLRRRAPSNVQFTDYIPNEDLPLIYSRAVVYAQPSSQETFGNAVAEAMLCECVPVVSRAGALPEVVGESGFYAEQTPASFAEAIRQALAHPELGVIARQRILKEFSFEKRRDRLLELVERVGEGVAADK